MGIRSFFRRKRKVEHKNDNTVDLTANIQTIIKLITDELVAVHSDLNPPQNNVQRQRTESVVTENNNHADGSTRSFTLDIRGYFARLCARPIVNILHAAELPNVKKLALKNLQQSRDSDRRIIFSIPRDQEQKKIQQLEELANHLVRTKEIFARLVSQSYLLEEQLNGKNIDKNSKPIMGKIYLAPIKSDTSPTGYVWRMSVYTNSDSLKEALESNGFTAESGTQKSHQTTDRTHDFDHRWTLRTTIALSPESITEITGKISRPASNPPKRISGTAGTPPPGALVLRYPDGHQY